MYRHRGSVQAVRPIRGVEVEIYPFMTTALEGGEGPASRPGRSLSPGKTRYPLYRSLGGPQGLSGQLPKISPPLGFDPRTVQPVASSYTDYATRPHYTEVITNTAQANLESSILHSSNALCRLCPVLPLGCELSHLSLSQHTENTKLPAQNANKNTTKPPSLLHTYATASRPVAYPVCRTRL